MHSCILNYRKIKNMLNFPTANGTFSENITVMFTMIKYVEISVIMNGIKNIFSEKNFFAIKNTCKKLKYVL